MTPPDANSPEGKLATALEQLATANASLVSVGAELVTANAATATAEAARLAAVADKETAEALVTAGNASAIEAAATIAELTGKLATADARNNDFDASVSAEVARVAASHGGAPVAATPDGGEVPTAKTNGPLTQAAKDVLYAKMEALPEAEQRAYYEKNIRNK